jgi:3-phenylpropionate/trans-cinnamate dioxygenase ferredoxin reductase subunit
MANYKYLIIGGGLTGDAAVRGIRAVDSSGSIGMFTGEPDPPYKRPLLSKGLWKGKTLAQAWCDTGKLGIDLHLGTKIVSIDPAHKKVRDEKGDEHSYDKLLLATGGAPRRLEQGGRNILYFRTMQDYLKLRAMTEHGRRFAVIGGGFIGSEIAAALAMNGKETLMIFPETAIGARMYPPALSRYLNAYYREKGVEVLAEEMVTGIAEEESGTRLTLKGRGEITVDGVVAGLGILPSIDLAREAKLEIEEGGIAVNERLQTGAPDVYAAGDAAAIFQPALGSYQRVEHEDNALTMGGAAGRSMAGDPTPYRHLPYFYSDLFDAGYEAVGELDSRSEIFADWIEECVKGVIYYLKAGRVRGVLTWNIFGRMEDARKLIAEPGPFKPAELKNRIAY